MTTASDGLGIYADDARADVLAAHQVESHGATATTPDRCTCGEVVHPESDPTTEGPAVPIEVRRRRAFAAHQARALAAATTETTAATTEDAHVLAVLNALHPKAAAPSLDYWGTEADKMRAALRAAGLLATARTRPTREQVTAAIGDAANSMQVGFGVVSITAAVDAVLALYADHHHR